MSPPPQFLVPDDEEEGSPRHSLGRAEIEKKSIDPAGHDDPR
jgi:hypothetical protein